MPGYRVQHEYPKGNDLCMQRYHACQPSMTTERRAYTKPFEGKSVFGSMGLCARYGFTMSPLTVVGNIASWTIAASACLSCRLQLQDVTRTYHLRICLLWQTRSLVLFQCNDLLRARSLQMFCHDAQRGSRGSHTLV